MLENKEMPRRGQETVSVMGIPGRRPLLVHQWHHLRRVCPKELEGKNETVQIVRGVDFSTFLMNPNFWDYRPNGCLSEINRRETFGTT